jgi:AcrR family transcriptional regulator
VATVTAEITDDGLMSTRRLRADAESNREKLLETAAMTFRRVGTRVPMSTIAERAGVGVGTLYRHFPDRNRLLSGLEQHSYELTLALATDAAGRPDSGIAQLRHYLNAIIANRDRLFLPLHGGSLSFDARSVELRNGIEAAIAAILERGRGDGTIRVDATPNDVVIGGTFLCSPLPRAVNWDAIAQRQLEIFLTGLAG